MKNLTDKLINEAKQWEVASKEKSMNFAWTKNASFMVMYTDDKVINFFTEEEVRDYAEDYNAEDEADRILSLEAGEIYQVNNAVWVRYKKNIYTY